MNNFDFESALKYYPERLILLDLSPFGVQAKKVYIYLDYLNHLPFSGNKLRKLYGTFLQKEFIQSNTIITIGGNYSNYLYACSFIPDFFGKKLVAIVKGYEPNQFGYTLKALKHRGADTLFYPKTTLKQNLKEILVELTIKYPNAMFIDEGGSSKYCHLGFEALLNSPLGVMNKIITPIGTSSTYLGIEYYLEDKKKIIGYAAHRDYSLSGLGNISFDYSFGGFGKINETLIRFINQFYELYQIPLDPVYTSKMMYGLIEDIKQHKLDADQSIVVIHTGGLQGWFGQKIKPIFYKELQDEYQYLP